MADQQIFNKLIEFFEDDNWDFQWVEEAPALSMGFSGHNGKWLCYAQAREEEEQFAFYSLLSVNVPPDKRHKVAEFITRVNYGMIIGNFEMDYDDGEMRYKTSIDVEGTDLTSALIRQIVYANLVITDRYLPGIMRVIYSDESPVDVLDSIEIADMLEDEELRFGDLVIRMTNDDIEIEIDELDLDDFDDDDFDDDDFDDDDFDDNLPPIDLPPTIDGGSPN